MKTKRFYLLAEYEHMYQLIPLKGIKVQDIPKELTKKEIQQASIEGAKHYYLDNWLYKTKPKTESGELLDLICIDFIGVFLYKLGFIRLAMKFKF